MIDMGSQPRGLFARALLVASPSELKEGAGKTGSRWLPWTAMPRADCVCFVHSGEQGNQDIPAFPAQWFDGLCRALPGERCTIAPVALRITDARARSGRHITARLGAQTPGARTTRFCRTPIAPVVCARRFAHGCPPCETFRADAIGVHRRPARVRDDRDTPLFLGPGCATHTSFPKFGKAEYFQVRALT